MDTKFTILSHETQTQIQPYCPVLLIASAITRNNLNGHTFAQCKFRNISNLNISTLSIKVYTRNLESSEKEFAFLYSSVTASPYSDFGDTIPIPLSNELTEMTGISIEKIQFDNGKIWVNNNAERFKKAIHPKRLADHLEKHLYLQYKKEVRKLTETPIDLIAIKDSGLIFCGCGNIYPQEYEKCPKCRTSLNDQLRICNPEFLEQCVCHERKSREERMQQKCEKIHKTIALIKKHPRITVACLSGSICALAAAFFAISIVKKQQDFLIRNPLSINAINTSQMWTAMGKNFYQVDVSTEIMDPIAAVFTMPESKNLQFVYLENGIGNIKSNFEEKPSVLPELLGYVTGQKADTTMISIDIHAGPQQSDLYSHTAIIDFSLDSQYGKDGIVLFNLYDSLSGEVKTNQYTPVVDGEGSISYSVDDNARVTDGSYDTPLIWAEKISTKIIVEPTFFISSEEMTDTAYTAEDDFTYTSEQVLTSSSGLFDFRNYQGEQHFALQDTSGLPKGMPKLVIYKDEDLNNNETTYKICKSNGRTAIAESYDFSGELNFTPKHKFTLISHIPLRCVGSSKISQNFERLSLDETKEIFQEEYQNFSNLIDDIETTVTYYAENEIETQEDLENFQKSWLQYSDIASGIQQRLSEKMPPLEYEASWKSFANSMQVIAEDLKTCSLADFDNVNQEPEVSSSFSVTLDQLVQHCYDVIDAEKELQQLLNVDLPS